MGKKSYYFYQRRNRLWIIKLGCTIAKPIKTRTRWNELFTLISCEWKAVRTSEKGIWKGPVDRGWRFRRAVQM